MKPNAVVCAILALGAGVASSFAGPTVTPMPGQAEMSLDDAWRTSSATRVTYCLNGLWRARVNDGKESAEKIPFVWRRDLSHVVYSRTFRMPAEAAGKRALVRFQTVNTRAAVSLDGKALGTVTFPGGELDVTDAVRPGAEQTLTFDVTAEPLVDETVSYSAADRAAKSKAVVTLKGVTGDVYLDLVPKAVRIRNAWAETSVVRGETTFVAEADGVAQGVRRLRATVEGPDGVRTYEGAAEKGADGTLRLTAKGAGAAAVWDIDTPTLQTFRLALLDGAGRTQDETLPTRFGFRDIAIEGRTLKLNGIPIHLRALHCPIPSQDHGVSYLTKSAALEMCRRLKREGFNMVIAGNYSCAPGSVSHLDALLEACDECGMLYSCTLPHVKDYGVARFGEAAVRTAYERDVRYWVNRVRNHPCVWAWAINHNLAGYLGDENPLRIDGLYAPEAFADEKQKKRLAARAAAHEAWTVVKAVDPTRPCYHHESGNLDEFHTVNIYLNWSPRQERSDWLEHWSEKGVKPLFFVEWGMPHCGTWSTWRGPQFIHREPVWQSLVAAEGSAAFFDDAAYEDSPAAHAALAFEEKLWASGRPLVWSTLYYNALMTLTNQYQAVLAHFMSDNWRSHRAWGITAMLPWDQNVFHQLRGKVSYRVNPDRLKNLKRPGIVLDELGGAGQYICDSVPGDDRFDRTSVGEALARWNQPDCAFIGGAGVFTDKRHVFVPGERIRKTLVILNDRRRPQTVKWACIFDGVKKRGEVTVAPGARQDVPVEFTASAKPGRYPLRAGFTFEGGNRQTDALSVDVVTKPQIPRAEVSLYDPKGLTAATFRRLGIRYKAFDTLEAACAGSARLVIGRGSLDPDGYRQLICPFAVQGGTVLVFEQDRPTLEAIGFRVQEYGLRQAFPRYEAERTKACDAELLRDWAGESTLVSPYFDNVEDCEIGYTRRPWAGFSNTRVWRCRNRGAVATVLPEKPTLGDWRALVDGGFDLQYAPLLEVRAQRGLITFCQLDVTARTVTDPAADRLLTDLVRDQPFFKRRAGVHRAYALGAQAAAYVAATDYVHHWTRSPADAAAVPGRGAIFVVSTGAEMPEGFQKLIENGAMAVLVGLTAAEVKKWCPSAPPCSDVKGRFFRRIERLPPELNGLSNAHWAWHGAMDFAAFDDPTDDGNEAVRVVKVGKGTVVLLQVAPWMINEDVRPYLRADRRRAWEMLDRVIGNLDCECGVAMPRYRDVPQAGDDPYRYYRW